MNPRYIYAKKQYKQSVSGEQTQDLVTPKKHNISSLFSTETNARAKIIKRANTEFKALKEQEKMESKTSDETKAKKREEENLEITKKLETTLKKAYPFISCVNASPNGKESAPANSKDNSWALLPGL